jgi:hypothetical protein
MASERCFRVYAVMIDRMTGTIVQIVEPRTKNQEPKATIDRTDDGKGEDEFRRTFTFVSDGRRVKCCTRYDENALI